MRFVKAVMTFIANFVGMLVVFAAFFGAVIVFVLGVFLLFSINPIVGILGLGPLAFFTFGPVMWLKNVLVDDLYWL